MTGRGTETEGSKPSGIARIDEERLGGAVGREVRAMMVTSTGSVSPETATWLDGAACDVADRSRDGGHRIVAATPYGWVVSVVEASDDAPEDLGAVLRDAKARGCSYVLFDRDAESTAAGAGTSPVH